MRLLLIDVSDALPAFREHFRRYPKDTTPRTQQQMREMIELVERFVPASLALIDYAEAVGGKPNWN